jgi:pimeloyl-ACP methyl ester carboxylesterase
LWLNDGGLRLKTKIYKSANLTDRPVLLLVLHGDLLEAAPEPTYTYLFARRAAAQMDNLIAAAVLRPGYSDDAGDRSDGSRGLATGDNYTPQVVSAVADAVRELKARFHPLATVLAGHSGGSAIAADVLGREPAEADGTLLVSCPCNVPEWRKHMARAQFRRTGPLSLLFLLPVHSLSPLDRVDYVPRSAHVRMVVGSEDPTTPVKFTEEYANKLRGHGVDARVTIAPGLGHNILLTPVVFEQLSGLVKEFAASPE